MSFFFKNPDGEYYLSEIAKNLNKEASYYQRYLDSFVGDEILIDERKGNLRFFRLNKEHPLYEDLKSIISKTLGIEYKFNELVGKLDKIEIAFIFGSIAKSKENVNSDIDLMLIGDVDQDFLSDEIGNLENELKREVNYHIFKKSEFVDKLKDGVSFFSNIINEPYIKLKGNPNDLAKSDTK